MPLNFMTAGESHGKGLVAVIEGICAGIPLTTDDVQRDLEGRRKGYGRGGRMRIESDQVEIFSGVRWGRTMGSPISLYIANKDYQNWSEIMSLESPIPEGGMPGNVARPRPGHGDLAGMLKFGSHDARDVLERASARETAARVALGAVCRRLLGELGVVVGSHVSRIGQVEAQIDFDQSPESLEKADDSELRCLDDNAEGLMRQVIDRAGDDGDTLGGVFEVLVFGAPPGLGSYSTWERRLDTRFCGALASIPGVKGVEVGDGFSLAAGLGSESHDEIYFQEESGYYRGTNHAGGLEAGMTNGEAIRLRAAMKPIPTLGKPLDTVDVVTKEAASAQKERADVCAVPSAAIIGEAVIMLVLADAVLEKFGGDSLEELKRNWEAYLEQVRHH